MTIRQRHRRYRGIARWAVSGLSTLLLLAILPAAVSAARPDPILLVHGYRGSAGTWQEMIGRFAAESPKRTAVAISLPGQDNIANARAIRDFIVAKGWKRVDIVGQSMGGLSARQFIKFLDPLMVDTYVSLGTPQYGILSACLLPSWYGGQMCPSSGFMSNLNAGDDTPGAVYWTTIYSRTDGLVSTTSSRLDGGACHVYEDPGVPHNDMDNDATIFSHVLAATDRVCAGTFKP